MNWLPLVQRWRAEADRRQRQLEAGRGAQTVQWGFEQAAIISTLRQCASQAEKSHQRQQKERQKEREQAEAEFLGEPEAK